jgi:quinol monooxygenase YgiN
MSINVVAVITAKPGSEDVVRQAMRDLAAPTRAEEGCLAWDLSESSVAPGTFVTVEAWRDPADLDQHMQTEHIAAAMATLGDALAAPPAIHPLTTVDAG